MMVSSGSGSFVSEGDFDLLFNRYFAPHYGELVAVSPMIGRVVCENPGFLTFTGTTTYIVDGGGGCAVIDPGPADEGHLKNIMLAIGKRCVSHILVTHAHFDHSPLSLRLKSVTGAPIYGCPFVAPAVAIDSSSPLKNALDFDFAPDVVVGDGDMIEGDGWTMECVFTPGHCSNHICFGLREERVFFPGDHVMGWSTSIIAPPDGNMDDYISSLEKIGSRDDVLHLPTHGAGIGDLSGDFSGDGVHNPRDFVHALLRHRLHRESDILRLIGSGHHLVDDITKHLYPGLDVHLHNAARLAVLSHIDRLIGHGSVVSSTGAVDFASEYRVT